MRSARTLLALFAALPFALSACSSDNTAPPTQDSGTKSNPSDTGGGGTNPPPGDTGGNPPPPAWKSVVGSSGAFAQTYDDASWNARVVADATLFGVACVGNYDGWTVGAHGFVAHTLDGGTTWSPQTSGTSADLHAVGFGDAMHGVAVGDGGTMIVTSDAGAHWTSVKSVTTTIDLHAATIAWAAGVWIAGGSGGTLARSIDDGSTWSIARIEGASDLRGVASDASAHVVLAVDASGVIWSSADAGVHFHREAQATTPLDAISIDDDAAGLAIATGGSGVVMMRDPLTRTWTPAPVPFAGGFHAALVTDGGTRYYVAGDEGSLFTRTFDSSTWQRIALPTTATFYGLEDL
jgi:photosystem II stability/assembly factor-like uncharacterized protein